MTRIGLITRLLSAAGLLSAGEALVAADPPTGGERGVYAYVLSNIFIARAGGDADICSKLAEGDIDQFFSELPAEQKAKYAVPGRPHVLAQGKRADIEEYMNQFYGFRRVFLSARAGVKLPPGLTPGQVPSAEQALEIGALNGFPKGRGRLAFSDHMVVYSSCSNPEDFPSFGKLYQLYDGKVAAGINLDGKTGKDDFSGTDGGTGVDNQLWRAVGCIKPFRESSERANAKKTFMSARAPTLIEVRGVDSLADDPDVTVNIYPAADPLEANGRGEALAGLTFATDPDPKLRASVHGRIVNGVLTTDPVDIILNYKEQIVDAPRAFRAARIQAKLKPDGIEGGIYGYYTLASYWASIEQMTQNGANLTGVSCPGVWRAINKLADGYRDPATGKFTAISSAYSFLGTRAFVGETVDRTAAR